MVDFKKLSKISDNLFRERQGQGQTVIVDEAVHIDDEKSPLDDIQVDEGKTGGKQKIFDSKHDKVLILDDTQIKSIMSSPRDKRRAILSKLSDAQRKRVLTRYVELKKVQDAEPEVKTVSKLDVLNLDNLAANYLFSPTDYNKSLLKEGLDSFGLLLDAKYQDFFNVLLSDGTAEPKYENEVQDWVAYCESLGLNSELSNVFELLESEEVDDLADPLNDDAQPNVDNSVTQQLQQEVNTSDTYTEQDIMSDSCTILADCLQKKFGVTVKQIQDIKIADDYVASALDKIEEKPFYDDEGNEVVPVEERPVLTLLTEALTAYQNGEPEKLEALAQAPVAEEAQPETEEQEDENPDESKNKKDGEEEVTYEEPLDISEDITVKDSSILANAILNKDVKIYDSYRGIHPIIDGFFDEFIDHVDDVDKESEEGKYDYCIEQSEYTPCQSVTEVPLTRDEFCTVYNTPTYFRNLCAECGCDVPEVTAHEIVGPCVTVNGECSYYPYACTVEELKEQMEQPGADIQKIIGSRCISLADACRLAAKSDNLNIIDNKFYKKSLTSPEWYFDECPSILKKCGVCKPSGTIQIADFFDIAPAINVNSGNAGDANSKAHIGLGDADNGQDDVIDLFGTKYIVR